MIGMGEEGLNSEPQIADAGFWLSAHITAHVHAFSLMSIFSYYGSPNTEAVVLNIIFINVYPLTDLLI